MGKPFDRNKWLRPHIADPVAQGFRRGNEDYQKQWLEFNSRNPFLAEAVETVRRNRGKGTLNFSIPYCRAILNFFDREGLTPSFRSYEDFDSVKVFWNLVDRAKAEQRATGDCLPLSAVVRFYDMLEKYDHLSETFLSDRRSPAVHLRREEFINLLLSDDFTTSDELVILKSHDSSDGRRRFIFTVKTSHPYFNGLFLDALYDIGERHDLCRIQNVREWMKIESLLGESIDGFNRWDDFNATIIQTGVDRILERYSDNRAMCRTMMRMLFHVFRKIVLEHPEHDFFVDSHLWNNVLLLENRVPSRIAEGYKPVLVQAAGSLPGYEKVLFVMPDGQYVSANGANLNMFSMDLSELKTVNYRRMAVNYVAFNYSTKKAEVIHFLKWLEDYKDGPDCDEPDKGVITRTELRLYRLDIANRTVNSQSRATLHSRIMGFLKYASTSCQIRLGNGALKDFAPFSYTYKTNPMALRAVNIKALDKELTRLGQTEPRFLVSRQVMRLMMHSELRAGQLCALDLDRLIRLPDGTGIYTGLTKSTGPSMVRRELTKTAMSIIHETEELTYGLRQKCPVGLRNSLFLYSGAGYFTTPFLVLNTEIIRRDMSVAGQNIGIGKVTSGMIRDTRMTELVRFARKHNLSDQQRLAMEGHARKISTNSYVGVNLSEILETVEKQNINIGEI